MLDMLYINSIQNPYTAPDTIVTALPRCTPRTTHSASERMANAPPTIWEIMLNSSSPRV